MKLSKTIPAAVIAGLLLFALIPSAASACFIPRLLPPIAGQALLTAADETGAAAVGVKFELKRADGTPVGVYETDAEGRILVSPLTTGSYFWSAADSPEADAYPFRITGRQSAQTAIVCAKPEPVPEPAEIDCLVLVNKQNPLPDGWEDALKIVRMVNSLGDDVETEAAAYEAYLKLKSALAEEGVFVDLDSAYRSVAAQQDIVVRFTEKYGADDVTQYVAVPGYSEHHTGLALDLYLNIDGEDVYLNEDMDQYPEIWAKIHAGLSSFGFILRYPEGKEDITGYSYEPWHIRYVGAEAAEEIASLGITLEEYLGKVPETAVKIDYGTSGLFTKQEMDEAILLVKKSVASWEGCELHTVTYAGDENVTEENVSWLNSLNGGAEYVECIEFLTDFHSPVEAYGAWEADTEYTDYQWWLGRTEGGSWVLVSWGY